MKLTSPSETTKILQLIFPVCAFFLMYFFCVFTVINWSFPSFSPNNLLASSQNLFFRSPWEYTLFGTPSIVNFTSVIFGYIYSSLSLLHDFVNNKTIAFMDFLGIFIFSFINVLAAAQTTVFISVICS